jgi:uncharacterized protein YjbI with pentapeptide repeats
VSKLTKELNSNQFMSATELKKEIVMIKIKNKSGKVIHTLFLAETLVGADLTRLQLQGACFRNENLSGANFRGSNLNGADFYHADLRSANFLSANLCGADLQGADLRGADIRCIMVNERTKF